MNTLKEKFKLNGLPYTLLKRNDYVALYGVGRGYTGETLHYEVDIINTRKDKYGERGTIADNEKFGRDRSRCYKNYDTTLKYYDKLTRELSQQRNQSQGVPKAITGVQQNVVAMSESAEHNLITPAIKIDFNHLPILVVNLLIQIQTPILNSFLLTI